MDKELISLRIDYVIKHIDLATDDIKNIALEDFDEYSYLLKDDGQVVFKNPLPR